MGNTFLFKKRMKQSKQQLRQSLIQQRRQLSDDQLSAAAQLLSDTAASNPALVTILSTAKRILSYCAFKGEISPATLVSQYKALIYLPKIIDYQDKTMHFYPDCDDKIHNRFGIAEPNSVDKPLDIPKFDVVLVPLVAFDQQGNRLGMGAGFYDRAFSATNSSNKKPLLIGLAHDFQQVTSLQPEVWDMPLDVILTPQKVFDPSDKLKTK